MGEFALYWRYVRLWLISESQYKGWAIRLALTLLVTATDPLDAALLLDRFGSVGGMGAAGILLVYSIAVSAFGFAELFARGFDLFPNLVKGGELDRVLLRPRGLFVQVSALRFHLNRASRAFGMLALAIYLIRAQGVAIGIRELALLLFAVAGGAATYIGIFALAAAASIFTIESPDWIYVFTNGSYQAAKVPIGLLPDWLRRTFLYVAPMFAFCHYPAASICRWEGAGAAGLYALPAGAAFLALSMAAWRAAVRRYRGAGS